MLVYDFLIKNAYKSDFVKALEQFWNGWAAQQDDILFIACGSATSWMMDKLVENQGGLHNRVTRMVYVRPFTLAEVEDYLRAKGITWDRYQIMQAYMIFGGVPYYYSLLDAKSSLVQNVDALFFSEGAQMRNEYAELYPALFNNADKYIAIIEALEEKNYGMSRQEIADRTGISGGTLTKMLQNLVRCDFIVDYAFYGRSSKSTLYRLCDFYSLFYLRFIANDHSKDRNFWAHSINTPSINSWQGYAFEQLCLVHLEAIKKQLGISGIKTAVSIWRSESAQIDLLIERADRMIHLCEMKFSVAEFNITKEYEMQLRRKIQEFQAVIKSRKGIIVTFVTAYGLAQGAHSSLVQAEVTLDALFKP